VYALLVPALFSALRFPYILLRQLDLSYPVLAFGRALLAALVLLLPATLMGGTFPILMRFWVRARGDVGRGAGLLYFVNTAGAIVGCLAAGFFLIESFGVSGTTRIAAAMNLGIAVIAGGLAQLRASRHAAPGIAPLPGDADGTPQAGVRIALFCIALSGFTSLGYEVIWTRALLRYLYNSTYAFTAMLAIFLAGIALGSAIYAGFLRRNGQPLLLFAILQLLVGLGFVASSMVFADLVSTSAKMLGGETIGSFGDALRVMFLRAGLILLPPTLFLGATLPLATAICARGLATLGYTVGRVYAVNTLGAILGSLAAGFVLIPAIGMQGTLTLLIALNFASALALAMAGVQSKPRRFLAGTAIAVVAAGALWLLPADLFSRTLPLPGNKLVFYREGATDTVGVVEVAGQRVMYYEDRRGTAGTASFGWNFFLGHLPLLLHPGEPRKVLHICFGVGNSLSAVAAHEEVERVDSVELSPHVAETADYFWTNNHVIANPKVHEITDDGRNFVMASREMYDVIELEPPETFTAGVINLYTREFYRDALARLAPDGVMMQWIPVGESPLQEERMLFRAFSDVFPHATAWRQLDGGCMLLIGTKRPLAIDYLRLKEKMQRARVRRDLELSQVRDVDHLLSFFVFDEAAFAEFVHDAPPVTDDRTVLDFSMPRYLGSGFGLGVFNLQAREGGRNPFHVTVERKTYYFEHRRSVVPYLTNLGADTPEAIAARIEARMATPITHPRIAEADWRRW
jgi:spermidine synthase